jgi:hypothetical protein
VARVVAFIPELLFGSSVQAALSAAGHEVDLVTELPADARADVLVVDLHAEDAAIASEAPWSAVRRLGIYRHTEPEVRTEAERAGFDLVVPRSRMAREGPALVERLVS